MQIRRISRQLHDDGAQLHHNGISELSTSLVENLCVWCL
jgi:hypothetical protein